VRQQIERGKTAARNLAITYLTQQYVKLSNVVLDWTTHQESNIDAMSGDPGDYWDLLPILVQTVTDVAGEFFPHAKIPMVIGGAIVEVKATHGKDEGLDAKASAKAAMRKLAKETRDSQEDFLGKATSKVDELLSSESIWNDNDALDKLERGGPADIESFVTHKLGITSVANTPPYHYTGVALRLTEQTYNWSLHEGAKKHEEERKKPWYQFW
jgi:hypothetical protein